MKVIFDTEKDNLEDLKKVLEVVKEAISKKENNQEQPKETSKGEGGKPNLVGYDKSVEKKVSEIFSSIPLTRNK